jgi:hypothetical protein
MSMSTSGTRPGPSPCSGAGRTRRPSRPMAMGVALIGTVALAAAALALGGCDQRQEDNPFIGPNGDALDLPFGDTAPMPVQRGGSHD